jgi:hypothetical protein
MEKTLIPIVYCEFLFGLSQGNILLATPPVTPHQEHLRGNAL